LDQAIIPASESFRIRALALGARHTARVDRVSLPFYLVHVSSVVIYSDCVYANRIRCRADQRQSPGRSALGTTFPMTANNPRPLSVGRHGF